MRKNGFMGKNVKMDYLAEKSKNFSGAEIEGSLLPVLAMFVY